LKLESYYRKSWFIGLIVMAGLEVFHKMWLDVRDAFGFFLGFNRGWVK